ncbi:MAG TPA: sigma-70 family RNA polymerase sigma factor [Polyangiaceae bacterium]|jgi:RNA polymerase sigma-70 factor (ECF subfamily)|nr:sigma-70 family RNA polymerase sigma factor [Polyangiaceae bacterium]
MATVPTPPLQEDVDSVLGAEPDSETGPRLRLAPVPEFRAVYETYFPFVWRYAANRGVPPMAIDDVVQEVFVVVHHRLKSFEGRSSLRTWLAGVCRNVLRDYLRKRSNQKTGDSLDDNVEFRADGMGPAEALERKNAVELVDGLLDQMTELQREVFILCDIEQLSAVEVASMLGVNENTLRTRLRAARQVFNAGVTRHRARRAWGERG